MEDDGLVAHADEELIHYSREFNAHNLLGFRVKPDKDQVADYKEQFRALAKTIRSGTSWEEYKRQNKIYGRCRTLSSGHRMDQKPLVPLVADDLYSAGSLTGG